jgi:hypothetical protein
MFQWPEYQIDQSIHVKTPMSHALIQEMANLKDQFFAITGNKRKERTRLIKDRLHLLAQQKYKFKAYGHGLSARLTQNAGGEFKNREWMYDIHWYTEGKQPYTTIRLPLVMECEWEQKRRADQTNAFSAIKWDFQKLLVANAELRMMVIKITNFRSFKPLTEYFINNIENYRLLEKGSKFLFIGFYERGKGLFYFEYIKKGKTAHGSKS